MQYTGRNEKFLPGLFWMDTFNTLTRYSFSYLIHAFFLINQYFVLILSTTELKIFMLQRRH
jgi:hypothetical protein